MKDKNYTNNRQFSRRDFIKASAAISIAAALPGREKLFAAGSGKLRVGLIGCGGQGTRDTISCLNSSPDVELIAMADLFKDRLDESLAKLNAEVPDKVNVNAESCFIGFDAYKKLLATNVDMVLVVTPPHFHPEHVKAAIEAGKHVFMEKPAAVDPAGIRSIIASSELAERKGLSFVAGTQRRHQAHYIETIKRIHNGDIGEIVSGQCYWNGSDMLGYWQWYDQSSSLYGMEWQLRNWPWFTWLSGDHIVEQHVHNLDIINWALQSHPIQAMGMGGRAVRDLGNIYDHFAVEFEYPNGVRITSMCRQINGCTDRVGERIVGTKGVASGRGIIEGQKPYKYPDKSPDPYVQEQADLINSIRLGKPINEGRNVAESTMAAIMGRMSAYTGRALKWDWVMNASKLDYTPPKYEFGEYPARPVATPGKTLLI